MLFGPQMDGGMIRGVDVWVSFASEENGYVELTPEAASNPWAMIGGYMEHCIYSDAVKPVYCGHLIGRLPLYKGHLCEPR